MKTNKTNKIEEYFQEIKAESVFKALKQKKYKGVKRSEIDHLLKKYNINQVYSYLKNHYSTLNYLLIYSISLFSLLLILAGTILTLYLTGNDFLLTKYIDLNYYKNLYWIDYGILFLLSASLVFLILCLYEIVLRIKLFK